MSHKGEVAAALDALGIDAVCDMIVDGAQYRDIAKQVGGSASSFVRWLNADAERSARARDALRMSAMSYDELAFEELQGAADPFELARAREIASHYRWRASKRNPAEYSEKVQQDLKHSGSVNVSADEHDVNL